MAAPSVQYVTTSDGYQIAYTDSGGGMPLVVLPSFINHVQDVWTDGFSVANLLNDAKARYRVINYDSRGMGMSTRGLNEGLRFESYLADLDSVLDRLNVKEFTLVGFNCFSFLAVRYALMHPERVRALVLFGPPYRWIPALWEDLPRQDWVAFLEDHISRFYSPAMARRILQMYQTWTTQEDYLASVAVWRSASVEDLLPDLLTPTLVLWSKSLRVDEQSVTEFARLLPNGRLFFLESGLPYGEPGEAILAIEQFLDSLAVREGTRAMSQEANDRQIRALDLLSPRELDIVRKLAVGKTNLQIADELHISINTVRRHVSNVLAKIGASNRTQAALYARDHDLLAE